MPIRSTRICSQVLPCGSSEGRSKPETFFSRGQIQVHRIMDIQRHVVATGEVFPRSMTTSPTRTTATDRQPLEPGPWEWGRPRIHRCPRQ